ncbi:response regulator transcription factor [Streptomyces spectabilis]|uniref:Response regulator transcription factor n=1 Tax=Streptomyces spectabilis TaxID=68270 RepID=A0A516RG76_STRST|nr:response regulator transcription factor [Streptomyces spectabilis]QDQ14650.1 response regulator transcription factor [Streptomyces spectabilis]
MSGSACTRILLVDSHPISLTGLRTILDGCPDLEVVAVAEDGSGAAARFRELRPDVVVVNSHTGAAEALACVCALSRPAPPRPANVLVLLDNVDAAAGQVLRVGVRGLLSSASGSGELAAAVRATAAGRPAGVPARAAGAGTAPLRRLTDRETEVFKLVARGFSNAEISRELTLSESTVKFHIQRIMEKLELRNRVHAVIFAYEKELIRIGS